MKAMLLESHGIRASRSRVSRLMSEAPTGLSAAGIEAIYPHKCLSRGGSPKYFHPYLLRDMAITRRNQVWSTDISYIRTAKGFMYLKRRH